MFKFFLSLLILAGTLLPSVADELKGKVVKVVDGDTLHINITGGKKKQRLRFQGIDAPETAQPHGKKSAAFLADLLLKKEVTIKTDPKRQYDQYGRMLGKVYIDGKDVELIMLSEGMAWHYKYHNKEKQYADAEQSARAAKKGLWKDPNPVQPYEFRKQQKNKQFKKKAKKR